MSPDDPRHGTTAGSSAGCHELCCRAAAAAWARQARARRRAHGALIVDGIGTRRRIHALMALGWSTTVLDELLGQRRTYTTAVLGGGPILLTTAQRYAYLYERMAMTLPPQDTRYQKQIAARTRNYAAAQGWPPPLAYDDIDDPDETPDGWAYIPTDRAEAITELDALHLGITEVCARLSIRRDNLERWCERHGMREVYVRMCGRETWREAAS